MKNRYIVLFVVLVISFALVACEGSGDEVRASCNPITDARDGQSYCTVTIGSQTWMAENLNYAMEGSYCYADDQANCAEFGRLYTYDAALRACPAGWHIPTRDEWWTLAESFNLSIPASQATGYENWPNATDSYGFSVRPGGLRDRIVTDYDKTECDQIYEDGCYRYKGLVGYFRVIDKDCTRDDVLGCTLVCVSEECSASFLRNSYDAQALSVRCIKGDGSEQASSVDSSSFSGKSSSSTTNSSSSMDSGSANVMTESMTDARDGQVYKTVTIGTQTWMAENLNFKTDSSFCYNNEEANCAKYGRLYRWAAAVGKSESECGYGKECSLPSGNVQGACPGGWHLPSEAEWNTLLKTLLNTLSNAVGWAAVNTVLKSTEGWKDGGNGTDEYGFSALPAGYRGGGGDYVREGSYACFWSASAFKTVMYVILEEGEVYTTREGSKNYGYSVRCLKD